MMRGRQTLTEPDMPLRYWQRNPAAARARCSKPGAWNRRPRGCVAGDAATPFALRR